MAEVLNESTTEEGTVGGSLIGEYYMTLKAGPYVRPNPTSPAKWTALKHVVLPLPAELREDTISEFSPANLMTVGDVVNGDLGGLGAAGLRASGTVLNKIATSAVGAIPGSQDRGDAVAGVVNDLFPADQITSAISQTLGAAPNPNPSVMFQGPHLREFSMSWTFFPRSRPESDRIQATIKSLKKWALPARSLGKSTAVLDYPWLVQLNFYPWDKGGSGRWGWNEANSLVRYKKCFMSSVNVNYNPSNVPAFFKGEKGKPGLPVVIQLTISFKEVEYFLSEDFGGASSGRDILKELMGVASDIEAGVSQGVTNVKNYATSWIGDKIKDAIL